MKILVLSDHFPPDVIGGYELGCFHVTEALAGRGHTCLVVTSRKEGISESISRNNYKTLRVLENIPIMPPGLARRLRLLYLEWHNYYALKKVIKQFQPDCVYVWKPYDLTVSTLNCLHDTNLLLVFYFFDLWFMRLQKLDFNLALQNFKKFNLLFQLTEKLGLQCWRTQLNLPHLHAQFCSKMVEDQCLKYFETRVISHQRIPFGINVADIVFDHEKKALNSPLRLLFSGRFCKEKGILIALETVKILSQKISVHCLWSNVS